MSLDVSSVCTTPLTFQTTVSIILPPYTSVLKFFSARDPLWPPFPWTVFVHWWMLIGVIFLQSRTLYRCKLFHRPWLTCVTLPYFYEHNSEPSSIRSFRILPHGAGKSNEVNAFQFVLLHIVTYSKKNYEALLHHPFR